MHCNFKNMNFLQEKLINILSNLTEKCTVPIPRHLNTSADYQDYIACIKTQSLRHIAINTNQAINDLIYWCDLRKYIWLWFYKR